MGDDNGVGGLRGVGIERDDQDGAQCRADDLEDDEQRHRGGLIPAKVSLKMRAMVTAGLANDVDDVNQ